MDINLFFSARIPKTIGGVQIDGFVREGHSRSTKTTEYPVEDGDTITDHIVVLPDELSIEGMVGPTMVEVLSSNPASSRILDTYQQIRALVDAREPVSIATGLKVYQNMVIKEFNVDRDASTGQSLPFTMTLKEIKTVKSQTVYIPASQLGGDSAQAQGTSDVGKASAGSVQDNSLMKAYMDGKAKGDGLWTAGK